ncbi:electron transport complex subunit RsxC [Candidatus Magnetominusculus xianensis]|uniref:Ion-translocating oxidoreductase complex subunit C n=1 Tax=Candidatus Magnetominusculus xianensis TaxID=1748249 RepID=A0ABR5SKF6_9BACT|nr:electron transport complex subunit RsxC [Candidatus Magnetominusculus xianensis]KWT94615.1 electron transporter RnfC [Candidatus Magnetominusculus xianensis]
MSTFTLGGIHPPEHKELACNAAIEVCKLPQRAVVPLSQHIGAPCKSLIEVGQRVLAGQLIGNPEGFISAPVHASIAGKVTGIEAFPSPMGRMVPSIVIENDKSDEWTPLEGDPNYMERSADVLKGRIKASGIVGMGGATFPTVVKLSPPKEKKIDAVIINGAECEPYLTADHRLMLENPKEIVEGLKILMKVLELNKGYIGIEENKPDAIEKMKDAASGDKNIEVWTLVTKYPQGAEKMLIKSILNREVPAGGLPMDVGVVVQNCGTAYAIYEACCLGKPLMERVVSVTGPGITSPKNLRARIGTPVSQLIETCGGLKSGAVKVISGGPMMGFAIYDLDTPVTKGTSGIVALEDKDIVHRTKFNHCIRCGRCVEACPMGLMPLMLSVYSEKGLYTDAKDYHLFDCFECGSCTYVCPSKRPIVQQIRLAKTMVKP